jgi:hypothetical protein
VQISGKVLAFPITKWFRISAFQFCQLPDFGNFGDLPVSSPLPYPSQIGVGFREVIPDHPRLA